MIGKHLPFGDNLKKVAIPTYFQSTLKISVSVMFWECIGPSSVGRLVKCHGQINAVKYIEILQDILHQSVKQMFGEKKLGHQSFNMIMHPHIVPKRPRFIQNCMGYMCFH